MKPRKHRTLIETERRIMAALIDSAFACPAGYQPKPPHEIEHAAPVDTVHDYSWLIFKDENE